MIDKKVEIVTYMILSNYKVLTAKNLARHISISSREMVLNLLELEKADIIIVDRSRKTHRYILNKEVFNGWKLK
ncbi:MAG: hypothetical protein QXL94_01695 [Candidatus Parvarchaeum sp.]